jgi:hypothetical protein
MAGLRQKCAKPLYKNSENWILNCERDDRRENLWCNCAVGCACIFARVCDLNLPELKQSKKWLVLGKSEGAKQKPARKLIRMNATLNTSNPKLLNDVAICSRAANNLLLSRHDPDPTPFYAIEEIHIRAETMTPLLKEILDFRPPPHWGINE